jgi:RNA polymerase sigma factor (sigma-70 family)
MDATRLDGLARQAALDDHAAFRAIVTATEDEIRLHLAVRAPPALIDELVQETYVEAWFALRDYQPRGVLCAWLKGIARNVLARVLRERARRRTVGGDALELLGSEPSAGAEVDDEALLHRLRECLARLPAQTQELLRRRYAEGHDLGRLAVAYKRQRDALVAQLYRVRQSLRSCVEQAGP